MIGPDELRLWITLGIGLVAMASTALFLLILFGGDVDER